MKQTLILDIEMATDITQAAKTDNIDDTLDYKSVAERVFSFSEENQFELVETFAEKITEIIRSEFSVPWVKLRLNKKGAVKGVRDIGVIIERGKRC